MHLRNTLLGKVCAAHEPQLHFSLYFQSNRYCTHISGHHYTFGLCCTTAQATLHLQLMISQWYPQALLQFSFFCRLYYMSAMSIASTPPQLPCNHWCIHTLNLQLLDALRFQFLVAHSLPEHQLLFGLHCQKKQKRNGFWKSESCMAGHNPLLAF